MNRRYITIILLTITLSGLIPILAHFTARFIQGKPEKLLEKQRLQLARELGKWEMAYLNLMRKKRELKTEGTAIAAKKLKDLQGKINEATEKKKQIEQQEEELLEKRSKLREWQALKQLLIFLIVGLISILCAWFFPATPLRWGAYVGGILSILRGLSAYGAQAPDWAYVLALVAILLLILFIGYNLSNQKQE